jgi:fatty acid desaturase
MSEIGFDSQNKGSLVLSAATRKAIQEKARELSQVSSGRALIPLFFDLCLIAACIYASKILFPSSAAAYLGAIALIAGRQHGLFALMHEGTHFRFFPQRRGLNDFLSEAFTAYPLFVSMEAYRKHHSAHHRFLNTEQDPDWTRKIKFKSWVYPTTRGELLKRASLYLVGFGIIEMLGAIVLLSGFTNARKVLTRLAYYGVAFGMLHHLGLWQDFALYWLMPFFSFLPVFMKVRSVAEHFGIENKNELNQTRTIESNWIAKLFLNPHNVALHLEHHMCPSIPQYRLPEFHQWLAGQAEFKQGAHLNDSYFVGGENSFLQDLIADESPDASSPLKKVA